MDADHAYGCERIVVLSLVEAIRRRPGMYVGGTSDGTGQHTVLWHLLDHAVLDHLAGHPTTVDLRVEGPRVWFTTNGRALPLDPEGGFDAVFERAPWFSLPVVNALSRELQVDVRRDGAVYRQHFAKGVRRGPVARVCAAVDEGVRLELELDPEVFALQPWNLAAIETDALERVSLCPGLRIAVNGRRHHAPDGLLDLLRARAKQPFIVEPVECAGVCDGIHVEVALGWVDDSSPPQIHGFANRERIHDSTVPCGLLDGIGAALRAVAPSCARGNDRAIAELVTAGLVAVAHVELDNPQWGQGKVLHGDEPGRAVAHVVERRLTRLWRARGLDPRICPAW